MIPLGIGNRNCAALVLLMVPAIPADPHSGGRVFSIPELTDEMLARIRLDDGSVDEWYDLIGEPTMTLLDFQAPYSNLFPDPSNLDFRIWLAWHDDPDRVYAAFVCSDDVYQNNYDPNADDYLQLKWICMTASLWRSTEITAEARVLETIPHLRNGESSKGRPSYTRRLPAPRGVRP